PLESSGCRPRNIYLVELTPQDSGLERRVTVYRAVGDNGRPAAPALSPDEAARLKRAYGVMPDTATDSLDRRPPYTAHRRFADIPDDLGNWGTFRISRSLLGSSGSYAERFRGDPDPWASLSGQVAVADSIDDLVLGWTESELEGQPGWDRLRDFISNDLRRQLRNAALASWLTGTGGDSLAVVRLSTHLKEYPVAGDLLSSFATVPTSLDPEDAIADLRARFAHLMGIRSDAQARRTFAFLSNPDSADASLVRYLTRAWSLPDSEATERFGSMLQRMPGSWEGAPMDSLEVRLRLPRRPFGGNGVWNAGPGYVSWGGGMSGEPPALPFLCFAQWSVPDSVRQRRVFGSTLLADNDLAAYCGWFADLPAAQQREWDRMLTGLKPGDLRPLERFLFSDERAGRGGVRDSTKSSRADTPRKLILNAAKRQK
ncbi:MAG TPA: hypothetical protein VI792_06490, partial [Candidatus Eisenbacteria bacterium]